jgi:hypothetical protein
MSGTLTTPFTEAQGQVGAIYPSGRYVTEELSVDQHNAKGS